MIVRTNTGQTFSGTPLEIVHQMHTSSRSPAASDQEFMEQASERMVLQVGRQIATDSPDTFIADLIETKMLVEDDAKRPFDPTSQVE